MSKNHQSTGGFLRSSAFHFIILGNLIFSTVFVLSLSINISQSTKMGTEQTLDEKQPQPKSQSIVTLANIQ